MLRLHRLLLIRLIGAEDPLWNMDLVVFEKDEDLCHRYVVFLCLHFGKLMKLLADADSQAVGTMDNPSIPGVNDGILGKLRRKDVEDLLAY